MKLILTLSAVFIFGTLPAQQLITSADEPSGLFNGVNQALAFDDTGIALKEFEKIIDFYVSNKRTDELPGQYFAMALMLALDGQYRESIAYHKKAIRSHKRIHHTEPLEMNINLGLTYRLAGKKRKAKKLLGPDVHFFPHPETKDLPAAGHK